MRTTPDPKLSVPFVGLACAALLATVAGSAAPGPESGAPAPQQSDRCENARVHAFDFWVGRWTVTNPEGDTVGVNRIRLTRSGCAILEEWEGTGGGLGTSLTAYDPGRDEWFQHWVGSGTVLKLTGGFEEGSLVLTGLPRTVTREGEEVELLDRIRWTPLEDGRVRQAWDISRDGGETWRAGFVGIYHPTGDM